MRIKKLLLPVAAVVVLAASAFTYAITQDLKIKEGYAVKFSGSGANGVFKDLKGQVIFDENNPGTAKFDVTIDVKSINTGNGLKNSHAKGSKWFDAAKYPVIHFVSSKVTKTGAGYQAEGVLEMHGVKKPLIIPFTYAKQGTGGTFHGVFNVNRTDFGIGEPGGRVDDIFKLEVNVPVAQ
ncbi:YceI family protein [Chitinophaga tropicalis]|uniref:YceI family protein n=1 Tax=Chitinophaga tropicalis TaxID=2683588 RepID=UPI0012F80674|nr:YceI family protein [Chitinophaga tropicalis]